MDVLNQMIVFYVGLLSLAALVEVLRAVLWGFVFYIVLVRVFGRNTCGR